MSLLGTILGIVGGLLTSTISNRAQNRNIQASLNAQKAENEKNREYNMYLAQQTNQQNVEQWERENAALRQATADERAYNSPSAQMARLREAGLNPDMYYGGGSLVNTSSAYGVASSPSMTAGAAASPMDWSALAGRKTIGDSVREGLEIAQMRANVEKTEAEADIAGSDSKVRDRLNELGLEIQGKQSALLDEQIEEVFNRARVLNYDVEEANWKAIMRRKFGEKYVEDKMHILSNETKLSDAELKLEIETLINRIAGINAENTKLSKLSRLDNEHLRLLFDVVKYMLE